MFGCSCGTNYHHRLLLHIEMDTWLINSHRIDALGATMWEIHHWLRRHELAVIIVTIAWAVSIMRVLHAACKTTDCYVTFGRPGTPIIREDATLVWGTLQIELECCYFKILGFQQGGHHFHLLQFFFIAIQPVLFRQHKLWGLMYLIDLGWFHIFFNLDLTVA